MRKYCFITSWIYAQFSVWMLWTNSLMKVLIIGGLFNTITSKSSRMEFYPNFTCFVFVLDFWYFYLCNKFVHAHLSILINIFFQFLFFFKNLFTTDSRASLFSLDSRASCPFLHLLIPLNYFERNDFFSQRFLKQILSVSNYSSGFERQDIYFNAKWCFLRKEENAYS